MQDATVTIQGRDYQAGFSFRSIREYEKMTGKSITECISTWDNLLFFYSTLKAKNKEFDMTLEAFVDEMDAHPDLMAAFQAGTAEPEKEEGPQKKRSLFALWMLLPLLAASPILIPIISMILWILMSLKQLVRLTGKIGRKRD